MKFQVGENVLMVKSYGNLDDFWWHGTVESVTKTRVRVKVTDPQGRSGVLEFTNKNPREYEEFEGWREYAGSKWNYSGKSWTLFKDNENSRPHYQKSQEAEAEKTRKEDETKAWRQRVNDYRVSQLAPLLQEVLTGEFVATLPYETLDNLHYVLRSHFSADVNERIEQIYNKEIQ